MASFDVWKKRILKFRDNPRALIPFLKKKFYRDFVADRYLSHYRGMVFLDHQDTIRRLVEGEESFVRFGDEIIDMFFGIGLYYADWHQRHDPLLVERLKEILASHDGRLLIGLHWQFFTKTRRELRAISMPPTIWTHSKIFLKDYLHRDNVYGSALCFQPRYNPELDLEFIFRYFANKHIIVVVADPERFAGRQFGATTDYVACPRSDSWSCYDDILCRAKALPIERRYKPEDTLFLVSISSPGKVLVYDLMREGWRAWDTGQFFDLNEKALRAESQEETFA